MKYNFLFIFLIILLFIPLVTSLNFDNVKSYDSIKKEITITNAFGLGDEIAKVTLNSPTNYYVIRGNDRLVAEFTINNFVDKYSRAFDNLEFYNVKQSMDKFNRIFVYKYKVKIGEKEYNNVTTICPDKDNDKTCYSKILNTWKEDVYEWKVFDGSKELPIGIITIGIFTDVLPNEKVEWIPTLFGVKINEWAYWTESLNDGLVAYYNLNEDSGIVGLNLVDSENNISFNIGSPTWVAGLIGNEISFDGNDGGNTTEDLGAMRNGTVSFWYNASGSVGNYIFGTDEASHVAGEMGLQIDVGTGTGRFIIDDGAIANTILSDGNISSSTRQLITVTWGEEGMKMWINGTLQTATDAFAGTPNNESMGVGCQLRAGACIGYDTGNIDELGIWVGRILTTTEILEIYNGGLGISYNNPTFIDVELSFPETEYTQIISNINLIANLTSVNANLTNSTLFVYNPDDSIFGTNTTFITGTTNRTNLSISGLLPANGYYWNYYGCLLNVTEHLCDWGATNRTFNITSFIENSVVYNGTSYETLIESFETNVTTLDGQVPLNTKFYYNGTSYSASTSLITGSSYKINRTIQVPRVSILTNMSWFFNFNISGIDQNTTQRNQTIHPFQLGRCNTTLIVPYINFTFKDENSLEAINVSVPSSSFNYYLIDISLNHTLTYINTPENISYGFCAVPEYFPFYVNPSLNYKSTGYPQRTYAPGELTLTNNTLNKTLYLLADADGLYVTFQVINSAEQPLSNVQVNATRIIDSIPTIVGTGTTDDAGSITFWLNPDYSHTFSFFKSGYDQYTTTITPTQTSYTVTLGGASGKFNTTDYTQGVSYEVRPLELYLQNDTEYLFTLNITSSYWDISNFGFILINGSGTNLGINSSATNGGSVSINKSTGNNTKINMNIYWVVDGTYVNTSRTGWIIYVAEEGNEWSIKNFFDDLKDYLSVGDGIFGLTSDSFSFGIIIFIVIFVFAGIMSYKYGINSPEVIILFVFGLVSFLEVGINIIPTINGFPVGTVLFALLIVGLLIREAQR